MQNLWWHYQYQPDRDYLEKTACPTLRDVAVFYADFMDQCRAGPSGKIILAPSVSPEHWDWTPNMDRNRNCAYDIAFVRFTFRAAIEAATILGRETELVERFKRELARLPDYPTTKGDRPIVVDVEDAPPIEYNIAVPAVPVFPGEQVTWFSSDAEKKLFARTIDGLRWNGNNSAIMLAVARSRLSMPNRWQWLKSDPCRFIRQVHPIPSSRMKKSVYVCLTAMLLSIHPTGAETTEAAEAHDVVIRHNRFINCGYGEGNFNDASCIDVFSNSTTPLPGSNKRILIEDNLCDAPGGHAIVVDSDAQGRLPGD